MDEQAFEAEAKRAIDRISRALDAQDPDVVEANIDNDVLKIGFPVGPPFVVNTQRPLHEVWLAANREAWHFKFDAAHAKWVCKKTGAELFSTVATLINARAQLSLTL